MPRYFDMKSPCPLHRLFALVVATLVLTPVVYSRQPPESKIPQAVSAEPFPNTTDGLKRLLESLLLSAKNDDEPKLHSQAMEMEIPNYESWFISTFGPEKGERWAGSYGRFLQTSELQFEMLWVELARQDGEISIEKVDTAKKYGTLAGPLDEYAASWTKTDASTGPDKQPIGTFCFVEGKFRLNRSLQELRILSPAKSGPVVPAKLINRIQPVYPETARQMRIQGIVALNVIIQKDGTVTVQNVGAGHPLLAPAAVAAVQQWRYSPTTINGEPVDVQTKVYVTFSLNRQPNEQKQPPKQ